MKNITLFFVKQRFHISVLLVLLLAVALRFYNYENRWALASDQARDAIIGREALLLHQIPTLGPFSQAGTFVMGPIWYWLVAIATSIYPASIITPWIVLTVSFVLTVYVMMLSAKKLGGKYLSVIVGLFTAVSTSQVAQSTNLTNPSGIAILSACSVYFAIKYVRSGKSIYVFLFSLFISLSINVHLQAIGLLPLFLITLILKRPNLKQLLISIGAFILPFIPLIHFDIRNNFYDTRSLIDFYLYGQYRIYLPNRWLTYAGIFWPNAWAWIIGGEKILGYLAVAMVATITAYSFWVRNVTKPMMIIIFSFLLSFIMLRYFRGERFDSYLIFLHPFILILTGWACLRLFKLNRLVGISIFILLVLGSTRVDYFMIRDSTAHMQKNVEHSRKLLIKIYPGKKFSLYDLDDSSPGFRLSLGLFLSEINKVNKDSYKIGIGDPLPQYRSHHSKIQGTGVGIDLWDINSSSSAELAREGAKFVNPSAVYEDVEGWYKRKKL